MNFNNDVCPRDLAFYDQSRIDAVQALRNNFDLLSIYEYGSVKAPGISDLDLIIVLNQINPLQNSPALNPSDVLPPHVRDIAAGGTVMVLDADLFSTINTWDKLSTNLLWGEDIPVKPASNIQTELNLARAVDWLPERILRLNQMTHMETVNTSRAIGLVYSLCHSIKNIVREFQPDNVNDLSAFIENINSMRESWFNTEPLIREQMLSSYIAEGASASTQLIPLLAEALSDAGVTDQGIEGDFKLGSTGTLKFQTDSSTHNSNSVDQNSVVLPSIFYEHFRNYALSDGMIGNRIRAAISPTPQVRNQTSEISYLQLLKERIDWVERQAKFLSNLGFHTGLYKFGWFFSPSARGVM
jgi:hypothetical protein